MCIPTTLHFQSTTNIINHKKVRVLLDDLRLSDGGISLVQKVNERMRREATQVREKLRIQQWKQKLKKMNEVQVILRVKEKEKKRQTDSKQQTGGRETWRRQEKISFKFISNQI